MRSLQVYYSFFFFLTKRIKKVLVVKNKNKKQRLIETMTCTKKNACEEIKVVSKDACFI